MMKKWKVTVKKTKSSTYILPMLDKYLNLECLGHLENSYLENNGDEKEFCILYKFSGKPVYIEFEGRLFKHQLFIGHEDYGDHVLYKFRLSEEMLKEVELFKQGRYSEFSKSHKESIINFLTKIRAKNTHRIKGIINKEDFFKKELESKLNRKLNDNEEFSDKPDMNSERFSNSLEEIKYVTASSKFNK